MKCFYLSQPPCQLPQHSGLGEVGEVGGGPRQAARSGEHRACGKQAGWQLGYRRPEHLPVEPAAQECPQLWTLAEKSCFVLKVR